MSLKIKGSFRQERNYIDFEGEIELLSDGTFSGRTWDRYGWAKIEGTLYDDRLEFSKKYGKNAEGSKRAISYALNGFAKRDSEGKIIYGRWEGCWTLPATWCLEPEPAVSGWAFCSIDDGTDKKTTEKLAEGSVRNGFIARILQKLSRFSRNQEVA